MNEDFRHVNRPPRGTGPSPGADVPGGVNVAGIGRPRSGLPRVIEHGKGVLCRGCLSQLLHRDVRPLTPSEALSADSPSLRAEKDTFLGAALEGRIDPADDLLAWQWQQHRDTYGITPRITGPTTA